MHFQAVGSTAGAYGNKGDTYNGKVAWRRNDNSMWCYWIPTGTLNGWMVGPTLGSTVLADIFYNKTRSMENIDWIYPWGNNLADRVLYTRISGDGGSLSTCCSPGLP